MNKFVKNLSAGNKELKTQRAERIGEMLSIAQTSLVHSLKNEVFQLENKIEEFTDLGMSHTTQLKFDKIEDGTRWVNELQKMKVELALKKEELKIAEETQKEWFEDETKEKGK